MFVKPTSDHLGQKFASKTAMCNHYGIQPESFDSRIKLGWDLKTALTTPLGCKPHPKKYIDHEGNEFETLGEMAEYWKISDSTLQRRLSIMKLPIKDALTMTTEAIHNNAHKCYDHLGNEFPSKKAMCEHYNIERQVFFGRMAIGWSLEKTLTTPIDLTPANSKTVTDHNGIQYKSISDMCKAHNMTRSTYNARIKNGWTKKDALTVPQKTIHIEKQTCRDHKGIEYKSINDMCKAYNITRHTYSTRVNKLKWSVKKALTTPNVIYAKPCTDYMNRIFPTKSDMAHFYALPDYAFTGKTITLEHFKKVITNRLLTKHPIRNMIVKDCIEFPYYVVNYNNQDYILHLEKILEIYHNDNFYPIPEGKLKDKNLIINSCIEFPYYSVTYDNTNMIWSYWQIIEYRKNTNFGLSNV